MTLPFLWRSLDAHSRQVPRATALDDGRGGTLSYGELPARLAEVGHVLGRTGSRAPGLLADNGPAWALVDLSMLGRGVPLTPLPTFFSDGQLRHAVGTAGLDVIITDQPERARSLFEGGAHVEMGGPAGLAVVRAASPGEARIPADCAKLTFTSGTTGDPKGVCLDADGLLRVAASLLAATVMTSSDVHTCVLPLSTLLENVGGVYRGLMAGARVVLPPMADVGFGGSRLDDPERLRPVLERAAATSAILVPALLEVLVASLEASGGGLPDARFFGVGGAPVPWRLLDRAEAVGFPVFEGYGLSEAGSVVALNTPRHRRRGSVGRPLPHVRVRVGEDGEIRVSGATCQGLLGTTYEPLTDPWLDTGDLGELDEGGFLSIHGRKTNVLVTAYGRNVSPEWVERELCRHAGIEDAVVVGEGGRDLQAVIVTSAGPDTVEASVARANQSLPDYARIGSWVPAREAFSVANGLRALGGAPRRREIEAAHAEFLDRHAPHRFRQEGPSWASTKS